MPNYLSRMKPNGANGTEYKLKDEELREAFDVFKEDIKGTQTVTGNPITLTDGSETYAQGLSVKLEPIQDLHGQSAPWVGGAGKNKFGFTASDFANGVVYGSAKRIAVDFPPGTYSVSSNCPTGYLWVGTVTDWSYNRVYDGNPRTFTLSEGKQLYVAVNKDDIEGSLSYQNQIEEGSNVTTFSPYSNICPIIGYEGVEVEDVGFNLFDGAFSVNNKFLSSAGVETASNDWDITDYIPVIPSNTYYISNFTTGATSASIAWYDSEKNLISAQSMNAVSFTANAPSNAEFLRCSKNKNTTNAIVNISKTTGTPKNGDYLPYQSRTASVTFGQTVYGGSVDVTDGGTDDEYDRCDLGDLTWGVATSPTIGTYFYAPISGVKYEGAFGQKLYTALCSHYKFTKRTVADFVDGCICFDGVEGAQGTVTQVEVKDSRYSTASDFANNLQDAMITYLKATPTTIATPKTDLKLLQDTNNITTNGTTITLDYIPNNSIGDAVKASEEYTDRAVEGKADNTTAYVDLPGNYDTTNKNFPTRSATSGSVQDCLTYINDLADKLYTAINSHATALANIPTKTVVVDHRAIDVGDDFNISLPLSYKFLIIELTIILTDELCYGSIVSTDFANGSVLSIVANGHGLSYWCDLSRMSNTITVDGNFDSAHGELTITAF